MLEQTNDKVDRMMAYMVALNGLTEKRENKNFEKAEVA